MSEEYEKKSKQYQTSGVRYTHEQIEAFVCEFSGVKPISEDESLFQALEIIVQQAKAEKENLEGMEKAKEDLIRRVESHIKGESCKGFCKACRKPYWNVDDEDMTCPYCGNKDFPVPDIDAQDISRSKDV